MSLFFITLSLFSFKAFANHKFTKIDLQNSFYWAQCSEESTPEDVEKGLFDDAFKLLEKMGGANLKSLVGPYGSYVWLKAEFIIPQELKNQPISLYAQYIHFANKVWINGHYAGSSGSFPPGERSSFYSVHYYQLPMEFLEQEGTNTLLIKVWCHGDAEISKTVYIANDQEIKFQKSKGNIIYCLFYMILEGIYMAAGVLYLVIYLAQRNKREYLSLSLLCFYTMRFDFIFFGGELPLLGKLTSAIPYLLFMKYFCCISWFIMFYFLTSFIIHFLSYKQKKWELLTRTILLLTQIATVLFIPTYNVLIKCFQFLIILSSLQLLFTLKPFITAHKNKDKNLNYLAIGLGIFLIGLIADFITRMVLKNTSFPYFTFLSWFGFNLFYQIILIVRYNKLYKHNAYLSENLQKAVEEQTIQIRQTNLQLEDELKRHKIELDMASIVQQKMFSAPKRSFVGWDFAITYEPLQEVSGDMFDFFNIGDILNGVALFDVSGHGVSASLITMLSKSIIFQAFRNSRFVHKPMSHVMMDINDNVTTEKGNIDNYLTGLICKFEDFKDDGSCDVQLANAGHPHPIFYKAKTKEVSEIVNAENTNNYGAIGLKGIDVSYIDVDFTMEPEDILVLFTDGLTEAENQFNKQFGKEKVMLVLQENFNKTAEQILKALKDNLDIFTKDSLRNDDLTIIVLKRERPEDFIEAISDD